MFSLLLNDWLPTTIGSQLDMKTISAMPPDLDQLRRQIDEIDDRLQDLLIERANIVAMVADHKKGTSLPAFRPGREAEIIRRLVARHHGNFPLATLVRMWREMLAATVRLQSSFAVAVFAPAQMPGFWDLARDHYGSQTPMAAYGSIGQVIRAVNDGQAAVGVLPMPQEDEVDPWWRHLLSEGRNAPRVIGRLPFGPRGNARSDGADALAIGRFDPEKTGSDRTLLAIETAGDVSRARMIGSLAETGLRCTLFASFSEHGRGAVELIEIEGFVPSGDPRLTRFREQLGTALHRILPFGGYAVPLPRMPTSAAATARGTLSAARG
jgi:chorismate mutase/prephenate dehydratase